MKANKQTEFAPPAPGPGPNVTAPLALCPHCKGEQELLDGPNPGLLCQGHTGIHLRPRTYEIEAIERMRNISESTWQAVERVLIAAQDRATTLLDNKAAEGTMVLREQVMYEGFDAVQALEVVRSGQAMEPVESVLALKSCHELLTKTMAGIGIDLADYLKAISAAEHSLHREGVAVATWINLDGTAALPSCSDALM